MKPVTRLGIKGLLTEKNQRLNCRITNSFRININRQTYVAHPLPMETVDFENGPYAIYNQELFFHIPDLISERLRQNQRYRRCDSMVETYLRSDR